MYIWSDARDHTDNYMRNYLCFQSIKKIGYDRSQINPTLSPQDSALQTLPIGLKPDDTHVYLNK